MLTKPIYIYILISFLIGSCKAQEQKENTITTATNIKQQDIYELYKTVEHYDKEIHYFIL